MKMFFKSYINQFSFTVLKCQKSERQLLMIDDVGGSHKDFSVLATSGASLARPHA